MILIFPDKDLAVTIFEWLSSDVSVSAAFQKWHTGKH